MGMKKRAKERASYKSNSMESMLCFIRWNNLSEPKRYTIPAMARVISDAGMGFDKLPIGHTPNRKQIAGFLQKEKIAIVPELVADKPVSQPKYSTKNKQIESKTRNKSKGKKHPTSPQDRGFLFSWEWRKLRYKVLVKYGAKCMLCGATKDDGVKICVDHIKPRHTHPELALVEDNLQVLCDACNMGKAADFEHDFRPTTSTQSDCEHSEP